MTPRCLRDVLALVVLTAALGTTARAQARFYPDDPLAREPVPLPVAVTLAFAVCTTLTIHATLSVTVAAVCADR